VLFRYMLCCLKEEQEALDEMRYYQQLPWEAEEALNAGVSVFSIVTTEVSRKMLAKLN
jgi:hypothetical protein